MAADDNPRTLAITALDALDLECGGTYDLGISGSTYYARREDGTGEALWGATPDELSAAGASGPGAERPEVTTNSEPSPGPQLRTG